MGGSSDGTGNDNNSMAVIKCKLTTIARDAEINKMLDFYIDSCAPVSFKMWILFKLYADECFRNDNKIDISQDTLARCVNLVMRDSVKFKETKNLKKQNSKTKAADKKREKL
jgi:hypothetical protein